MIESPTYYKTEGDGKLYVGKYNYKVEFQVFLANQDCVVYCKMDKSPDLEIDIDYSTKWSLKGVTKDKRTFFATHLMITQLNSEFVELISNNNIIIGDYFDFAADKIVYPLANLYDINFETKIYDFKISLKSEIQSIKKNISRYWGIPQVASELILEKNNEPIDSYTEIANYIIQLLSLGNIQNFFSESKRYTLLQNNQMSSNSISTLLLNNEYPNLLKEGIPILKGWSIDKFKDLRTVQHFLNSTDRGFVDDRILKLIQCYEIIAHNWIQLDYKLPPELLNLKKKLKTTIKDWKQELPEYDKTGFWSGRIHKSLEWEKTVKLLENVLTSQNLDLQKLNVDFNKLVELRHAVAHKGRFGEIDALNDLLNGQYALRIFLLKTFNYNGKIRENRKTGWTNFIEISELLKASA